ncbi:protein GUCD1-like isoform X2 [Tachypleus tridentatus]|uniref:protein GUCD1-like isoform X2 n=1 Tax=Tachypleus tridentatus TaxID=6853 RepID=UPI003FD21985
MDDECSDMVEVILPHVKQRFSWDCGISAVLMVLGEDNRYFLRNNLREISFKEGFGRSKWSIDLAYLLRRFQVDHLYCTITFGVHPEFKNEEFYKQTLSSDVQRVNEKFEEADKNYVHVQQRSVDIMEILDHLRNGFPAIVLVNANELACDVCASSKCWREWLICCQLLPSYQGHYIVVCGFQQKGSKILYRNPANSNRVCTTSFKLSIKPEKFWNR